MLNLTPHAINILLEDGQTVTLPPSGAVARVLMDEKDCGNKQIAAYSTAEASHDPVEVSVPVVKRQPGAVTGLPDYVCGDIPAVVSALVAAALPGAPGIYAPDTGPTAVRDEHGNIVAVRRLIKA